MVVYSNPKSNQRNEKALQEHILSKLKGYQLIEKTHLLFENWELNPLLDIRKIELSVSSYEKMSERKKYDVLRLLNQLPNKIRVAQTFNQVSVDLLILDEIGTKHYIEFHEYQHRTLSNNRPVPIFDEAYNRYEVPRILQRSLKDIWRFKNLKNYSIIWLDWYKSNPNFDVKELFRTENKELFLPNKFAFSNLLLQ